MHSNRAACDKRQETISRAYQQCIIFFLKKRDVDVIVMVFALFKAPRSSVFRVLYFKQETFEQTFAFIISPAHG
jgi:hypothetical protein